MLPKDPAILLSVINTKLRDFYSDLDALCDDLEADKNEIVTNLSQIGYKYSEEKNQFIWHNSDYYVNFIKIFHYFVIIS